MPAAVLIDRDKSLAKRRFDPESAADQCAWTWLLGLVPGGQLCGNFRICHAGRCSIPSDRWPVRDGQTAACVLRLLFLRSGFGLEHHFLARAGYINSNALAAQLPGQQVDACHILDRCPFGKVDRF